MNAGGEQTLAYSQFEAMLHAGKLDNLVIGRDCIEGRIKDAGQGKPKGSRNKASELLIKAFRDDFAQHGADTIASVRERDLATYLAMVRQLVPREALAHLDHNYGEADGRNSDAISDDDYCAFIERHYEAVPAYFKARRNAALQMAQRGEAGDVPRGDGDAGADVQPILFTVVMAFWRLVRGRG